MRTPATRIAIALSALALAASPAYAGLEVCNKSGKTVWVAVTYDQLQLSSLAASISWGWLQVDAGACKEFFDKQTALQTDGEASYYALVRDDAGFWSSVESQDPNSGTNARPSIRSFCIKPSDGFMFAELHSNRDSATCERHDYFLLETNRQADFTMTLLPQ